MQMTAEDWHRRFTQQSKWTSDLRFYLDDHFNIQQMKHILDVGCGTGVISKELNSRYRTNVFGLDIESANLELATKYAPQSEYTLGDAHTLPYPSGHFDLTFCHFLLLWVTNPIKVICEMTRVTRTAGYVVAYAEPDYGGRIDYPDELELLGKWQQESLYRQGANAQIGRHLAEIFNKAGLDDVKVGVLGGQWTADNLMEDWLSEWQILENDLSNNPDNVSNWDIYKSLDLTHRKSGDRILYVPTFYAFGQVASRQK